MSDRNLGFCGALLEKCFEDSSHSLQNANWQRFRSVPAGMQIATRNQVSRMSSCCAVVGISVLPTAGPPQANLNFLLPAIFSPLPQCLRTVPLLSQSIDRDPNKRNATRGSSGKIATNPGILTALAKFCIAETEAADRMQTALGNTRRKSALPICFLHLMQRIAARSVIVKQRFPFPLRQQHIADASD